MTTVVAQPHPPVPVPLALWPLSNGTHGATDRPRGVAASRHRALAERLVAEYSEPTGSVVDADGRDPAVSLAAVRAGRRAVAIAPTERLAHRLEGQLDEILGAKDRRRWSVHQLSLRDAPLVPSDLEGRAQLVCSLAWRLPGFPSTTGVAPSTTARQRLGACSALLRAGGIVAVRVAPARPGTRVDPLGQTIASAVEAGLTYLQHVVVLRTPIRDGALVAPRKTAQPVSARWTFGHRRVHDDLAVFVKPGADGAH